MLAALLLAAVLPPLIADPAHGPSDWVRVRVGEQPPPAAGYLLDLSSPPDQRWLETAVALGARGALVVSIGREPPVSVLAYLDGVALVPAPPYADLGSIAGRLAGVLLVVEADDAASAVAALAAGATSVLLAHPDPAWAGELHGLLPAGEPAQSAGGGLATAVRGADLATVVGLGAPFPGGPVLLPGGGAGATLVWGGRRSLPLTPRGGVAVAVELPALPGGGVLVVTAASRRGAAFERVEVAGEQQPSAAEIVARYQLWAARQELLVRNYRATQRLLVRVWIAELSRSFEVVLEGPAFWEAGAGSDWEITRAWVNGVAWDPDALPDLPLLEPRRPPIPPLAVRLDPAWQYRLAGTADRAGRSCFVLEFEGGEAGSSRRGKAYIDRNGFALVAREETDTRLTGDVRASHSVLTNRPIGWAGRELWMPEEVVTDDLLAVFGGTTTVHRELLLTDLAPASPSLVEDRAAAWSRSHGMLRDTPTGVKTLVPDGRGGRTVAVDGKTASRFLLLGVVADPGLAFPLPFGGLQIQDFHFRGRDEQLRLLLAGVVNDGAWSTRHGPWEFGARGFVQLLPFTSERFAAGREVEAARLRVLRQRVGTLVSTSLGRSRLTLDLGVDRLDFSRADETANTFVLPASTFESVVRLALDASFGQLALAAQVEAGHRLHWQAWGIDGREEPVRDWRRGRVAVVYERAPWPLAKLHLDGELWVGSDLDRFSALTPGRFGGVRLRGIASDRILADKLAVVRAAVSVPISLVVRVEGGVDAAWAHDLDRVYRATPLSGASVGLSAPGPWGTLLQASLGAPLATPGPRALAFELFLLRPLKRR
jgi:hypothetical protein